ncbi:hypothetical protein F4778DRAFT_723371 [Xylariomycetidae sp. FL2044]|nr:hypothetical protein F4778DRAFT_723371 [Xylariomycetidae sp. FL2044]
MGGSVKRLGPFDMLIVCVLTTLRFALFFAIFDLGKKKLPTLRFKVIDEFEQKLQNIRFKLFFAIDDFGQRLPSLRFELFFAIVDDGGCGTEASKQKRERVDGLHGVQKRWAVRRWISSWMVLDGFLGSSGLLSWEKKSFLRRK